MKDRSIPYMRRTGSEEISLSCARMYVNADPIAYVHKIRIGGFAQPGARDQKYVSIPTLPTMPVVLKLDESAVIDLYR